MKQFHYNWYLRPACEVMMCSLGRQNYRPQPQVHSRRCEQAQMMAWAAQGLELWLEEVGVKEVRLGPSGPLLCCHHNCEWQKSRGFD